MKVPEQFRQTDPRSLFRSTAADGNNGLFFVPYKSHVLQVIASDGEGWEHVSVSMKNRCPLWQEMCHIKNLFWDKEDTVIQFHPPESQYVNQHPYCLHLWKPIGKNIETPPSILVGLK